MPLYRERLDQMICAEPGCDHTQHDSEMYLHSACHPSDPTWAYYQDGVLTILCATCKKMVTAVHVASKEQP